MAKDNSTDSKAWTADKLRLELEKEFKSGGFPPDLRLTSEVLYKHLPTDLLPLLPQLDGVAFCHLDKTCSQEQVLAVRKDSWGIAMDREVHVKFTAPCEGQWLLYEGGSLVQGCKSLHQALYLLTL